MTKEQSPYMVIWRKVKGDFDTFMFDIGMSPVDVVNYNKKTGYVSFLICKFEVNHYRGKERWY